MGQIFELLQTFAILLTCTVFLQTLGFALLSNSKLLRLNLTSDWHFLLSIPLSISVLSFLFVSIKTLGFYDSVFADTLVFKGVCVLLFIYAAYNIYQSNTHRPSVSRLLKQSLVISFAVSLLACCFVLVNIEKPIYQISAEYVSKRALFKLPEDNFLQFYSALSLIGLHAPWVSDSWSMGDRPPLAGLLFAVKTYLNGVYSRPIFWDYQVLLSLLNALYIIPLARLCSYFFYSNKIIRLILFSIALSQFFFLNTYFAWPKLLGAYFALLCICYFIENKKSQVTYFICGLLYALGALSHTGVLISLPLIMIAALFNIKSKHLIRSFLFLFGFTLFFSSWNYYKKQHPQIKTYNLIHDHYFPTQERRESFSKNFPNEIPIFFEENTNQLSNRIKNVVSLSNNSITHSLFNKDDLSFFERLNSNQFYFPLSLLGEGKIMLTILVCFAVLFRKTRNTYLFSSSAKNILYLLCLVAFSYIFTTFLKWTPPSNHALPYLEPLVAMSLIFGVCYSFSRVSLYFFLTSSCVQFFYFIYASSLRHSFNPFGFFNITIYTTTSILLFYCIYAETICSRMRLYQYEHSTTHHPSLNKTLK